MYGLRGLNRTVASAVSNAQPRLNASLLATGAASGVAMVDEEMLIIGEIPMLYEEMRQMKSDIVDVVCHWQPQEWRR